MSGAMDPSLRGLTDCGCCEGRATDLAPRSNRPGLSAITYRAGDWRSFKDRLLARLSTSELAALAKLRVRDDDDFTIGLLDAFATMADVLTFYQERNANETFLRTATERFSVLELARLIGYEPNPGVAADVHLAFTVEDVSGGTQTAALSQVVDDTARTVPPPTRPVIPVGTKVQSVPGPDEEAQIFETVEELEADLTWNRIRPRLTEPRFPQAGDLAAWFQGSPLLEPGDRLLFVGQERLDSATSDRWNLRRVIRVEPDDRDDRTRVVWDQALSSPPAESRVYVIRSRASVFGSNASDWMSLPSDTKAAYLGLAAGTDVSAYTEWPHFEIFSPQWPPSYSAESLQLRMAATVADVASAAASAATGASQISMSAAANKGMGTIEGASLLAHNSLEYAKAAAAAVSETAGMVAEQVIQAARIPLDAGVSTLATLVQPAAIAIAHRALDDLQVFVDDLSTPSAEAADMAHDASAMLVSIQSEIETLKDSVDGLALDENPAIAALDSLAEEIETLANDLPELLTSIEEDDSGNLLVASYQTFADALGSVDSDVNVTSAALRAWLDERIAAAKTALAEDQTSPFAEAMQKLTSLPQDLGSLSDSIGDVFANPSGTVAELMSAARDAAASAAAASQTIGEEVSRAALETGSGALRQMDSLVRSAARDAADQALHAAEALNPLPALQGLADDSSTLASAVDDAARAVTAAIASSLTAGAVDIAVRNELQRDGRTPASVAAVAKEAARIAVEVAPHVVTSGTIGAAGIGWGPTGAIAAAAAGSTEALSEITGMGGIDIALGHAEAATQGAASVQAHVASAVEVALADRITFLATGRSFPQLTDDTIDVDASFPQLPEGSWIVLALPDGPALFQAEQVDESSRSNFMLSGKTTRIRLRGDLNELGSRFGNRVRQTAVFLDSDPLELAPTPVHEPVRGDEIVVAATVEGMEPGRRLIVTGRKARRLRMATRGVWFVLWSDDGTQLRPLYYGVEVYELTPPEPVDGSFDTMRWRLMDDSGFVGTTVAPPERFEYLQSEGEDAEPVSELAELKSTELVDEHHARIELTGSLTRVYERASVTIAGNVAHATHGESVEELLGSGDAARPFQRFPLLQPPLTHVSASTVIGSKSTLEVRVNDVAWAKVSSLYGRTSAERVFTTRLDDSGTTTVIFGNGDQGARLPTGTNNVRASYRKYLGTAGLVKAGQLSQLMTRPLGVTEVTNPLDADGAQDAESLDDARANAPLQIVTLDRVVSLQDYQDFARAFAGVVKALATWTWVGERNGVYLTIAGPDGAEISETSTVYGDLLAALREYGDPRVPLGIGSYWPRTFHLSAGLHVDADYEFDLVRAAAEEELSRSFSFESRGFGQPVAESEVVEALHRVGGVVAVDVNLLHRTDESENLRSLLGADVPRPGTSAPEPAELLTLDTVSLQLEEF